MNIQNIVYTAIFAALTAIGAFISIPFGPISFTLQSFFTIASGMFLGPKLGALSQLTYLILGLIGLPIFSGFTGGIQTIFKPSFGFLIGFILAAYISGLLSQKFKKINFKSSIFIGIISSISIYLLGIPYMHLILNKVLNIETSFYQSIYSGLIIFIPTDLIKLIILAIIQPQIHNNLKNKNYI